MLRGPGGHGCALRAPVIVHSLKKVAGAQRNWSLDAGTGTFSSVPTSASSTRYSVGGLTLPFWELAMG